MPSFWLEPRLDNVESITGSCHDPKRRAGNGVPEATVAREPRPSHGERCFEGANDHDGKDVGDL